VGGSEVKKRFSVAVYLSKMDQKALSMTNNSLHETNRIEQLPASLDERHI